MLDTNRAGAIQTGKRKWEVDTCALTAEYICISRTVLVVQSIKGLLLLNAHPRSQNKQHLSIFALALFFFGFLMMRLAVTVTMAMIMAVAVAVIMALTMAMTVTRFRCWNFKL